jgi:hypothetical protein
MATRDLHNHLHFVNAEPPVTQTNSDTAFTSATIDTAGYESLEFVIALGGLTDADVTATVVMNESDDSGMSGSNAVADANLLGTEAACAFQFGDDNGIRKIGYVGSKRYVNLVITPSGNNSGALPISVLAILGHPRHGPTATLADA